MAYAGSIGFLAAGGEGPHARIVHAEAIVQSGLDEREPITEALQLHSWLNSDGRINRNDVSARRFLDGLLGDERRRQLDARRGGR